MSDYYFGAAESMLLRYETYMTALRRMTTLAAACAVIGGVGFAFGVWGVTRTPETRYFVAQKNGQILPLTPLNQPYLTHDQVIDFVSKCVTKTLGLNFVSWKEELSAAQPCFTQEGWRMLTNAIDADSGTLDFIVKRRFNAVATVSGAKIMKEGHEGPPLNRYVWRLTVPVSMDYTSSVGHTNQNLEAVVEVVRTETYENDDGVAISRFVSQAK